MTILNLSSLSLHHFRNYEHVRVDVSPKPVVLFGHNGAGKTNILEAISLLAPGRGLRRAKLADMAQSGHEEPWAVVAYANGLNGEVVIGTGKDVDSTEVDKRALKIDGKPARSQAELAKHLSLLWLTPQMEQLFNEGTSEARKFLDRLVYTFDSEHATIVNAYDAAMRERNRLLVNGNADGTWLSALENTMAQKGSAIAAARLITIQHINHAVEASALSFPKPTLNVAGVVEDVLHAGKSALEAEEQFREVLRTSRYRDAEAGRTLLGTHRSELIVMHREKGVLAHLCSTGEQKALLLSVILAQSRAGARWSGVIPIVLLDEVVAHLDPMKRLELFDEVCDTQAQVWMTGTDRSLFEGIEGRAQFFEVRNGTIWQ